MPSRRQTKRRYFKWSLSIAFSFSKSYSLFFEKVVSQKPEDVVKRKIYRSEAMVNLNSFLVFFLYIDK